MEASSARMAARDRFSMDPGPTPLQRYIAQACSPENFSPNLSLNLEICDLINSKKGNAPREAAVAIVNYVNHRNPNVALLALSLLDYCVKNCGYPFHLQVGTKEFLNELVRRFPERPPIRATRVQMKILEAIEEWKSTICQTSRYKEDLGFIRDMHRLLSYKGYVFPQVRREDAAVLNPSDNLKSAEEMEEEERSAQSAKLQELIRRGGPEDLQEANRLMKIMAGYDTRSKTDYRAKAAEEVGKIQQKARLLEERLEAFKPGDKMEEGDVYEELASSLQSAQPKIQKMCEEESDDHEAVAKLFEINDSIHRTVERYKLLKKGDYEAANKIERGTLGSTMGVAKGENNELSLIDFDEPAPEQPVALSTTPAPDARKGKSAGRLDDDLLGLQFGGVSLQPQAAPTQQPQYQQQSSTQQPLQDVASSTGGVAGGLADDLLGLQIDTNPLTPPQYGQTGSIGLGSNGFSTPQPSVQQAMANAYGNQQQQQQPQYSNFQQPSHSSTPKPVTPQPQGQQPRKKPANYDPFASLLD